MWQHLEYLTEDLLQKSEAKERVNCHIPPFVRYLEAATIHNVPKTMDKKSWEPKLENKERTSWYP